MAREAPIGDIEPTVSVEEGLRRVVPERSGVSIGPGISDIGDALEKVQQSEAAQYTIGAISSAQSQWHQRLQDAQAAAPPGAPGFTPALMDQYQQYVQQQLRAAPSPLAAKMLQGRLQEFGAELAQRSMNFEVDARQKNLVDSTRHAIDDGANEVMNNPDLYAPRLQDRLGLIDQLNLPPDVRAQLHDYATQSYAKYATIGNIGDVTSTGKDPYAAMFELTRPDPQQLYTRTLSPETRMQLIEHADTVMREKLALIRESDSEAERQEQKARDAVMDGLIQKAHKSGLTQADIDAVAPTLKPSELNFLYDLRAGKDVKDDPHTFVDLVARANAGQDVTEDARAATYRGLLTTESFMRISDLIKPNHPSWFKQGMDYVTNATTTNPLVKDYAANLTKANLTNEWIDWANEHPKATQKEAESAVEGMVRRYQLLDTDQMFLTLQPPRFLVGTRLAPNLEQTKMATAAARAKGEISQDEYDQQMELLMKWDYAAKYQAEQAAKDAAQAKK